MNLSTAEMTDVIDFVDAVNSATRNTGIRITHPFSFSKTGWENALFAGNYTDLDGYYVELLNPEELE